MSPKIAIIVLNWNGKKDTLACLQSLAAITYSHHAIILVDNGSTDDTLAAVRAQFPHVHCIALPHNVGFAAGNNAGIAYALKHGADYIVLLNNDTLVVPDLLEQFLNAFTVHPQAGIIGARIYLFDSNDTLDHLGGIWIKKRAEVRLIGWREKEEMTPTSCIPLDYVCGACIMIKRSVIETVGMLEPRYFLYWEENDYCLLAKRAGFDILSCPQAKIWHKVSASITGGRPHFAYFWWRGRLLWIERQYPLAQRTFIYLRIIFPAFLKLLKMYALKAIQLQLSQLVYPKRDLSEKRTHLKKSRAAFAGIRDYFLRRFGNCPAWISKK